MHETINLKFVEKGMKAFNVLGETDNTRLRDKFDYDSLTAGQKVVYDDFISLSPDSYLFILANAPFVITGKVHTNTPLTTATTFLNYDTLSAADKTKVDDFKTLLLDMNTI